MKKSDLKSGMVVELKDGSRYIFLKETQILCGERYGYNINSFYDDLTHYRSNYKDIIKVYRPLKNGRIIDVINNSIELIWERKEIELTKEQIKILKALKTLGFNWISRDKDGDLHAYNTKPKKFIYIWNYGGSATSLDYLTIGFDFIKWSDEEPTNINELLRGMS